MREIGSSLPLLPLSHISCSKESETNMTSNNFELKQIEYMLHTIIELLRHLNSGKSKSGIYTQKEVLALLNISPNTLKSWENKGLKRLEPPIEGTRTVYYRLDDIIEFLSCN